MEGRQFNCRRAGNFGHAQEWANGGSMVGALRGSTQKEPIVVGKPSTFMTDYVSKKLEMFPFQSWKLKIQKKIVSSPTYYPLRIYLPSWTRKNHQESSY